jgi:hypothetical protein
MSSLAFSSIDIIRPLSQLLPSGNTALRSWYMHVSHKILADPLIKLILLSDLGRLDLGKFLGVFVIP